MADGSDSFVGGVAPTRGVRCGIRQLGTTALLPTGFYEQPRVAMTNSVCNCGRDSTRQPGPATDRYGNLHTSRFVRSLAGCATLISIEEFVLVAQNVRGGAVAASVVGFRRWPRRTAGRGLGSLSRFGDGVESVCCGGPQSSVGCGVRGRPSVIASPGSLQRHPARTGIDRGNARRRRRTGKQPRSGGDSPTAGRIRTPRHRVPPPPPRAGNRPLAEWSGSQGSLLRTASAMDIIEIRGGISWFTHDVARTLRGSGRARVRR